MTVWYLAPYYLVGFLGACSLGPRPSVRDEPFDCLPKHSPDNVSQPDGQRIRIDGPPFKLGDRIVLIVDDSVRGVARVMSEEPIRLDRITVLDSISPHDLGGLTVIKAQEAGRRAAPCAVEGGIKIRTASGKT